MMVNLELQDDNDLGVIARFKRDLWSDSLGRHFPNTDLIIVVKPEFKGDLLQDFEIYRTLPEAEQMAFLAQLKETTRYDGRMLTMPDPEPEPVADPTPVDDSPQLSMF